MRRQSTAFRLRLSALLASSSVAALLVGGGTPPAVAAPCVHTIAASFDNPSGQTTANVCVHNTSFSGAITNEGTISPSGIAFVNGTITGFIQSTGIVNGGISLDKTSNISGASVGIFIGSRASGTTVTVPRFTGGISNAGTISAGPSFIQSNGIFVGGFAEGTGSNTAVTISTFTGGITNSGLISASGTAADGIFVGGIAVQGHTGVSSSVTILSFSGNITDSGTISAQGNGIFVGGGAFTEGGVTISTFAGNIINSGTVSAGSNGIFVGGTAQRGRTFGGANVTVSNFSGGISNSGTITAGALLGGNGIFLGGKATGSESTVTIGTFGGSISNSGTIAAAGHGILVGGSAKNGSFFAPASVTIGTLAGGITNSGTLSAAGHGIFVGGTATGSAGVGISSLGGGISNSGSITAGGQGIFVGGHAGSLGSVLIGTFSGGITNSGMVFANKDGIFVGGTAAGSSAHAGVGSFAGGISNSGSITAGGRGIFVGGTATGFFASAGIGSFTGGITNSGTIVAKTGIVVGAQVLGFSGAIANSGTITGTGGTAIDVSGAANAMTINQTGGLISGAILLSANADVLNISGGTINGNIVGQGTQDTINFNLGAGSSFTYAAPFGFSGINQVNIDSGTVILNGVNSAANVDVFGGTLAGSGTLDPLAVTIHSGGAFAPGLPGMPGTSMTIAGNLASQMNAAYVIYLNPSASTFADVTGTATLNGTVDADFGPGTYMKNKTYDILHSGGLSGTFAGLVTNNPDFTASLSYNSTDVFLTLTGAMLGSGTPLNVNQQHVANALNNFFNNGGTLPPGFASVFNLTGTNLANALTALDGENATGAERSAFDLMNQFLNLMLDPYVDGRGGATGGGPLGFAPDQQASLPPDIALAYAGVLKAPPASATFDQRWSAWGSAFGGANRANGDPIIGSTTVTASDYGFAGGMDYRASPDTVLGFALAGGGTNWGLAQGLGTGRSDAFLAGAYGATHWGPAYVAASFGFADHWFTTNRTSFAGDQLTANFNGQSYGARLEGGYRYAVPVQSAVIGVTPYAAVQAQWFHTPTYSETDLTGGGFGLTYNAMNATDTRSELGGRFDELTTFYGKPLMLRGRAAWAHDWVSNPALSAAFEALPGASFTVFGAPIPKDSALTSAGAQLFFTPRWSLTAKFDGEFAKGAQTYAGTGMLRYTW